MFEYLQNFNPTTLLPIPGKDDPTQTCSEIRIVSPSVHPDLSDQPLANTD